MNIKSISLILFPFLFVSLSMIASAPRLAATELKSLSRINPIRHTRFIRRISAAIPDRSLDFLNFHQHLQLYQNLVNQGVMVPMSNFSTFQEKKRIDVSPFTRQNYFNDASSDILLHREDIAPVVTKSSTKLNFEQVRQLIDSGTMKDWVKSLKELQKNNPKMTDEEISKFVVSLVPIYIKFSNDKDQEVKKFLDRLNELETPQDPKLFSEFIWKKFIKALFNLPKFLRDEIIKNLKGVSIKKVADFMMKIAATKVSTAISTLGVSFMIFHDSKTSKKGEESKITDDELKKLLREFRQSQTSERFADKKLDLSKDDLNYKIKEDNEHGLLKRRFIERSAEAEKKSNELRRLQSLEHER